MAEKGVKMDKRLKVWFVDGSKAEYVLPETFDVAGMFTGSPRLVAMPPSVDDVGVRWLNPAHVMAALEYVAKEA